MPVKKPQRLLYTEIDAAVTKRRSGMKPKVQARAAELNAEPELFQFKANITYLIKKKAKTISYLSFSRY